jgi:hypothetical protein
MRNYILSFVEANFFKVRYIFENISNEINDKEYSSSLPDVCFERITHKNFHKLDDIYSNAKNEFYFNILFNRVENPDYWKGYLAQYNEKPVGCYWILIPQTAELQYDSFVISSDAILFCGAFVNPAYRGKKIYSAMQYYAYILSRRDYLNRKMNIIVEKNNYFSLKSIERSKFLSISGKNYLIKVLGRNILSIYLPKFGNIKIWPLIKNFPNYDARCFHI